ncbi:unnamed protein product [Periconia digitata]|uniref:Tail specific protease domain-containing protein n=1 Tax=Periconia digitata TaxID=1303443 RepID=A0A9W4U5P7_9PLEO|nr:unnamed protein product [Periconia digitata]
MRSTLIISAAIAAVSAQSFSSSRTSSLADDAQPTETQSASGPIDTKVACGTISELIGTTRSSSISVDAELAHACLSSIPIFKDEASQSITSLKQMMQFQSTLSFLKNPPKGYWNEKVDIIAGLEDIEKKVSGNEYAGEYDFETDISSLLVKAHDGHLSFVGAAFGGMFKWRRSRQITLISASQDGKEVPKVYVVHDFNHTSDANIARSAVKSIDGKEPLEFLRQEGELSSYHDPDTQYNAMFYMQPAENYGYFANPRFYPGKDTKIEFENGTSNTYPNTASIQDPDNWGSIQNGEDAYDEFIIPKFDLGIKKKRTDLDSIPHQLQNPREPELTRRFLPSGYPKEVVVQHSAEDVPLAGVFIDGPEGTGKVGVLVIQTFNTETAESAREFQTIVQDYIAAAQSQKVTKHIIDVRTNGGGKILLGYDTYLQFFPSKKPQLMSRFRGHKASELFGEKISSLPRMTDENGELYTSPFNYHSYLNKDNEAFTSWSNMYPPNKHNDDSFTDLLRYNLSDPFTTSSDRFSVGVEMTGFGSRSNFTTDPFSADDIYILSDGICASTCSLFIELMSQQATVRTLAVGGRPQSGPMQSVGGTKGSLVLQESYLMAVSAYIIAAYGSTDPNAKSWLDFLPQPFAIATADASVNFQDNIRKGLEKDGVATQFMNDTANCRFYFEPSMYVDPAKVWSKASKVAFGNKGQLDEAACVPGSFTKRVQAGGSGASSSGDGEGGGEGGDDKDSAAAPPAILGSLKPVWVAAGVSVVVFLMSSDVFAGMG